MRSLGHDLTAAVLGLAILFAPACNRSPSQAKFATPEEAAAALHQAFKSQDLEKMKAIFGREAVDAVASGDPVSDRQDREVLALAMQESWRWEARGPDSRELIIGDEQWPFPIPLVKTGSDWQFDSKQGRQEVLARRIGGNELDVISLCGDYIDMQKEYASEPHDGKPAGLFAQHLGSSPGHQDGLYWPWERGGKRSPLGDLMAQAGAEGYDLNQWESKPFHGYRYRILTAQGPAAPGGKKSYVVNGDMKGGFALLAYPAKYKFSGVMTFIVNQDGAVYQKDLGPDTATLAPGVAEYNPDDSWTAVQSGGE
jgi:Protein of unknown function (DUF2950)